MITLVALAYLVDLILGDPSFIIHPVILQGKLIAKLERHLNKRDYSSKKLRVLGAITVFLIVSISAFCTWFLVFMAYKIRPICGLAMAIWLTSTTIAQKGLRQGAKPVALALDADDLITARQKTGEIVGRDTTILNSHELVRATVETVAENTLDAVTAPLFYAFLGGAPLAMAYRATNTLDSMLGYKDERYLHFGWAAARFDDLVNYLPARLSALFVPLAAAILQLNFRGSAKIIHRDAPKHLSPNSGYLEAGFAGAMDITLGGRNIYKDRVSDRALLGDIRRELCSQDILTAIKLMETVSFLFFFSGLIISLLVR